MSSSQLLEWFRGRIGGRWFEDVEVRADREEILVIGTIPAPSIAAGVDAAVRRAAALARIDAFREETREPRMAIAAEAEARFERKVSWGVRCDGVEKRFTVANVPVMTRLLLDERQVLDTLIDGGIARSRSEALAWCVKLVGANQREWIEDLRRALVAVEEVRGKNPLS